jgi:hypothetical protein
VASARSGTSAQGAINPPRPFGFGLWGHWGGGLGAAACLGRSVVVLGRRARGAAGRGRLLASARGRCGRGKAAGAGALWDSLARTPATFPLPALLGVGMRKAPSTYPAPSLVVMGPLGESCRPPRRFACGVSGHWLVGSCSPPWPFALGGREHWLRRKDESVEDLIQPSRSAATVARQDGGQEPEYRG